MNTFINEVRELLVELLHAYLRKLLRKSWGLNLLSEPHAYLIYWNIFGYNHFYFTPLPILTRCLALLSKRVWMTVGLLKSSLFSLSNKQSQNNYFSFFLLFIFRDILVLFLFYLCLLSHNIGSISAFLFNMGILAFHTSIYSRVDRHITFLSLLQSLLKCSPFSVMFILAIIIKCTISTYWLL